MKNVLNKIFHLLIVGILVFTITSCRDTEEKTPTETEGKTETLIETGEYIYKDGVSDYVIVIPEDSLEKERLARDELIYYFKKATGVTLDYKTDRDLEYDTESKYISIGNTVILKESGISLTREELTLDGFKIKRNGSLVIIGGVSDEGTLYGTYEFMSYAFKYHAYAVDEIYYEEVESIPLLDFNVIERPDFEERMLSYYSVGHDQDYRNKMRLSAHGENWIYASHSHFSIMPKATYYNDHKDWYSLDGTQLCLTNEEMTKEFIENVKKVIITHPEDKYILLGEEDANTFCTCSNCRDAILKYGTPSGVDIVFVNKVAKAIEEWLQEVDPTREMMIGTFAYLKTLQAPVKYDSTLKEWVPNHPDVVARDNVIVLIAPLGANFSYSFLTDKNIEIKNALLGWQAIIKQFAIWTYSANFYNYFTNFLNFSSQAQQYRELYELNTLSIVDQGPWDSGAPVFEKMRTYVMSQLMWDTSLNVDDLIDDFMVHYYKEAYPHMRKYFDITRSYLEYLRKTYGLDATCYVIYNKIEYWPQAYLNSMLNILEDANKALEVYMESSPTEYETLTNRINLESLSPRYFMLRYYQNTYTPKQQLQLIDEFEEICQINNVTNWAESTNMAQGDNTIKTLLVSFRSNVK